MAKIGVLLIGGSGAIASSLVVGVDFFKRKINDDKNLGMLTNDALFDKLELVSIENIILGGWDFIPSTPYETCVSNKIFHKHETLKQIEKVKPIKIFEGILTESDFILAEGIIKGKPVNYKEAITKIRNDIRAFKKENEIDDVVLVNISSPHKNISIQDWHHDSEMFEQKLKSNDQNITSGMLYCLAGIDEGCPFIEFTPSSTLEPEAIIRLAEKNNVALAGRDGSTGQTLLKYVLSPMFRARNLKVEAWYSTNVLGNNDGKVLSNSDYSKSKMHDKSHGLKVNLGYEVDQIIDIKYLSYKKDNKESWDLIEFVGWMGEEMSLRINWNGKDSVLAAPLIFDLIRLISHSNKNRLSGIQKQLGVFFKNPMGSESRSFFYLQEQLINHYKRLTK